MIPGISTGGGGFAADWGSTASNQGGTNSLGGFSFGDYNPPPAVKAASASSLGVPLLIGGGVLVVGLLLVLAVKK